MESQHTNAMSHEMYVQPDYRPRRGHRKLFRSHYCAFHSYEVDMSPFVNQLDLESVNLNLIIVFQSNNIVGVVNYF